jgi:uncharacterized protein
MTLSQVPVMAQTATCPPEVPVITPQSVPERMRTAKNKGFLYSFSKDGQTSWLFGTLHLGDESTLFPGPQLQAVLNKSKAVALELDLTDPAALLKSIQAVTASESNQQIATSQRLAAIAAAAKAGCVPIANLTAMPIMLQAMTLVLNEAKFAGYFTDYSQESFLTGFAKATGKKLHGLETMDEQMRALVGENPQELAQIVDSILGSLKSPKTQQTFTRLVAMWRDTDVAKLNDYDQWCNCLNSEIEKKFMSRLIEQRNVIMLGRALKLHDQYQGSLLVGVGSLHLLGETGLVKGLEKLGFKVERLY